MTSAKFSNRFSNLLAFAGLIFVSLPASAQNTGYTPPDMFEDMTPPMVRPATPDGYLVRPKTSSREDVVPRVAPQVPTLAPRMSIEPGVPSAPLPIPPATRAPVAPTAPKMMAPIVEKDKDVYIQRQKPEVKAPVPPSKPVPPPAPAMAEEIPAEPVDVSPQVMPEPAPQPAPIEEPVPAPTPEPAIPAPAPDLAPPNVEPVPIPTPEPTPQPAPETVPAEPAPSAPLAKEEVPMPPVVAPVPIAPQIPVAPTPPAPPSAAGPIIEPVPRDPSESVIQGPKTMPSLPIQGVEGQATFEAPVAAPEPTIMERHTQEVTEEKKEETLTPIVPAPKNTANPASFDSGEQGALKKTVTFQPGQIGLPAAETDSLAAGVVNELDAEGKEAWRVQIKSFATPHGTGVSSDRRVALSRALSLRSSLIAQGVSASRIDVLAEGLQSDNSKPGDRIDLYLYGPKE